MIVILSLLRLYSFILLARVLMTWIPNLNFLATDAIHCVPTFSPKNRGFVGTVCILSAGLKYA